MTDRDERWRQRAVRPRPLVAVLLVLILSPLVLCVLLLAGSADPTIRAWRDAVRIDGGNPDHADPSVWPADWPAPNDDGTWLGDSDLSAFVADDVNGRFERYEIRTHRMWGGLSLRVAVMRSRTVWTRAPRRQVAGTHDLRVRWQWGRMVATAVIASTVIVTGWCIIVMLWAEDRRVREDLRTQRGDCSGCAYPRGGSDTCSECGAEYGVRAARTNDRGAGP